MSEPRSPEQNGHIIVHEEGVGVPFPELIERRARELAVIAGRAASEYTDEDFRQARQELGRPAEAGGEESEELPFEPGSGDVLGGREHQAQNYGAADESTVGQELIGEGMNEALHDEMLEARKKSIRDAS